MIFHRVSDMDISNYTFVALDLETTGLDTNSCRIIEIAAVRFNIFFDGEKYTLLESEERSMLIDPEIEITSEVTMITGISEPMIRGKSKWHEVKEKVADFIGDSIIVGHNVLFDIAVLKNHGLVFWWWIKESWTQTCNLQLATCNWSFVLDTFELSELLAQEAESLNLAFLANLYGFSSPGEHRALDDTIMSVHLFLYFLTQIRLLDVKKQSIFVFLRTHDETGMMNLLCDICEISKNTQYVIPFISSIETKARSRVLDITTPVLKLTSFRGEPGSEMDYLKTLSETWPLLLLVQGYQQVEWVERECLKQSLTVARYFSREKYISLKQLTFRMDQKNIWTRKYVILIGKLLFWLQDTKKGILSELKYYGDERTMIDGFRAENGETHTFIEASERDIRSSMVTIAETHDVLREELVLEKRLIIRDIERFDDAMRNTLSKTVDFTLWETILEEFITQKTFDSHILEQLTWWVYALESLFVTSVKRPTGPNLLPPGDFGETYHCMQASIWSHWGRWSILYTGLLLKTWKSLRNDMTEDDKLKYKLQIQTIGQYLQTIETLFTQKDDNISIILSIQKESTRINVIPRNVRTHISHFFSLYWEPIYGYGTSISGEIMQKFIREEIFSDFDVKHPSRETIPHHRLIVRKADDEISNLITDSNKLDEGASHIILTTSLKHIRDIGTSLRKAYRWVEIDIFIQGVSWGKGKMLTNFTNSKKKKILVGLIDTWRDEFELWERADAISLMKLPFDPPTDVRFLARTVGMKDNFEGYSMPTTLIKVNTVLGRILSNGYEKEVVCYDERLLTSEWWKKMYQEML